MLFSYRRNTEGQERGAEIRAGMETEAAAGLQGTIPCTKAQLLWSHPRETFVCPVLESAEDRGSAASLAMPAWLCPYC